MTNKTLEEALKEAVKNINIWTTPQCQLKHAMESSANLREGIIIAPEGAFIVKDYQQFVEDYKTKGEESLKGHLENGAEISKSKSGEIVLSQENLRRIVSPETFSRYMTFVYKCAEILSDAYSDSTLEGFTGMSEFELRIPSRLEQMENYSGMQLQHIVVVISSGDYDCGYEYTLIHGIRGLPK